MQKSPKVVERFLKKIEITNTCWFWIGAKDSSGYGSFVLNNKQIGAHRAAYQLWNDEIPTYLCILHTCDTGDCVNPDHLWLGTKSDNAKDMVRKNRMYHPANKGIAHGSSKLTYANVIEMRNLYSSGQYSQRKLAERFNISYRQVKRIVDREQWRHI